MAAAMQRQWASPGGLSLCSYTRSRFSKEAFYLLLVCFLSFFTMPHPNKRALHDTANDYMIRDVGGLPPDGQ